MLSNESGPGRPTGLHPGLAEMKEEEGKVGWRHEPGAQTLARTDPI